jgi:putative hydrolase of the HAD superfamily
VRCWLDGVHVVVFDAVGTLIHPEPPACDVYAAVGQRYGSRLDAAGIAARFAAAFARQEALDREAGLQTSEAREVERWRAIVAECLPDVTDPAACFQELFAHFGRPDAWRCAPDARPTLCALADHGYRLAMASNYDRRLRSVAGGLSELQPIETLVISSEVGWRKPAPAFFTALGRALGEPREQLLFVGDDRANDYDGARRAGLRAVLVKGRADSETDTVARLSDLLLQNL